jgi:hypothetical protein
MAAPVNRRRRIFLPIFAMRYYLLLQYKMLNRQLRDFGIQPLLGNLLLAGGFVLLSWLLFARLAHAPYLYMLLCLALLAPLHQSGRNRFLQGCYGRRGYRRLRLAENGLAAMPFIIFLVYKTHYWQALALGFLALAVSPLRLGNGALPVLPTPFGKQPFESIAGFRRNIGPLTGCYAIAIISVAVGNANLGIAALLGLFILCLLFYQHTEPVYYVWIFALSPHRFLWHKTQRALGHATLLCLPAAILLTIGFPGNVGLLAGVFGLGLLYMATVVAAKYAVFPDKMNLPQVVLLALGLSMPPLLLVLLPYFYTQSLKKLRPVLS